ncbi:MAG TPA: putative glycoside hydrolase, partial [Polyangiaceae bacterium]
SGGSAGSSSGGATATGRSFPDTNASIAILADQLPPMNDAQLTFAASHYVGTEKQHLPVTQALRAKNPQFLVLHYHLSMWQAAPATTFITDGTSWGNDYPTVTTHEAWFWHNASNARVASSSDAKLLMNVSVPEFQQYWADSLAAQVKAGDYDGIFFDSASPALLQGECAGADPRLAATAVKDTQFSELGGKSWIEAWQAWMSALNSTLLAQGIPLIPNTSAFATGWDNTDYSLTAGAFVEGFADLGFAVSDWQASTNELLKLAAADKIMILQSYLKATTDLSTRMYYLGNYLLVKGHHTYLDYFSDGGALEWYPEWNLDLGAPLTTGATVSDLSKGGVYRRDFAKGSVFVNPSAAAVMVDLGGTFQRVLASGGGAIDTSGTAPGSVTKQPVTSISVAATSAEIVLK